METPVDFTLKLYKLMDADTTLNATAVRQFCTDLLISYPKADESAKSFTPKQTALMKIAMLCWNFYSGGSTEEPDVKQS